MAPVPRSPFDVRREIAGRIDRYASPAALATVASTEVAICELIFLVTEGDRGHIALLRDRRGDRETWTERYAIIWVARSILEASFPKIGRALASDHSSIIRAFGKAQAMRRDDRTFRQMTDRLAQKARTVQKQAQGRAKA
jgi:chromosomal replication initiation ATPase DnaA